MSTVVKVFLASPRDLMEERKVVRARAEQFNRHWSDEFGIYLKVIGWEDLPPTAQRAQQRINRDADDCDLFVGLMATRWGSDSGEFSSGFEEEFFSANNRRKGTGVPDIALLFKAIETSVLADPGPQLTKVLEFKKAIIETKEFLFKEFSSDGELADFIDGIFSEFARSRRNPALLPTVSTTADKPGRASSGNASSGTVNSNSINQVLAVSAEAGADAAGDMLDFWGRLRLWLYAQATYAEFRTEVSVDVHAANHVYVKRRDWELTRTESWMMTRTMLRDTHGYVPGWFWLADTDASVTRGRLWYYCLHDDEAKKGAAAILAGDELITVESPDVKTALVDPQTGPAICELLTRVGSEKQLPLLEEVKSVVDAEQVRRIETAEFSIRQRAGTTLSPAELSRYITNGVREAVPALLRAAVNIDEAGIASLIQGISNPGKRGALSLALAKAGLVPPALARALLTDDGKSVREAGVRALIGHGQPFSRAELSSIFPEDAKYKGGLLGAVMLVDISSLVRDSLTLLPPDQLIPLVSFFAIDAENAYAVLGDLHWDVVAADVERQLDTDFQLLISESDAKDTARTGVSSLALWTAKPTSSELVEYKRSKFIEAALRAVAKHGHSRAAEWGSQYSAAKYNKNVREAAFALLLSAKAALDYAHIMSDFPSYSSGFAVDIIPAAISALGVDAKTVEAVGSHKSADVRRCLVEWLASNWRDSYTSILESLLVSETDSTRKLAAHVLIRRLNTSALEPLFDRYLSLPRYFYDVVTLFDIALYAVSPYRSALLTIAPI